MCKIGKPSKNVEKATFIYHFRNFHSGQKWPLPSHYQIKRTILNDSVFSDSVFYYCAGEKAFGCFAAGLEFKCNDTFIASYRGLVLYKNNSILNYADTQTKTEIIYQKAKHGEDCIYDFDIRFLRTELINGRKMVLLNTESFEGDGWEDGHIRTITIDPEIGIIYMDYPMHSFYFYGEIDSSDLVKLRQLKTSKIKPR